MPFTLHLTPGGAYPSNLRTACSIIRANGTNPNVQACTITHPGPGGAVSAVLYINLAYQPNANAQPPTVPSSLYVMGFQGAGGAVYAFNLPPLGPGANWPLPGSVGLGANGSYQSLGYPAGFGGLMLTDQNLRQSILAVNSYVGGALPNAELVRLIIASSEALRIRSVATGVGGALGPGGVPYPANWAAVHSWNSHGLSS